MAAIDEPTVTNLKQRILDLSENDAKSRAEKAANAVNDVETLFRNIENKLESLIGGHRKHRLVGKKTKPAFNTPAVEALLQWKKLKQRFHSIIKDTMLELGEQIMLLEEIVRDLKPILTDPNIDLETRMKSMKELNETLRDQAKNDRKELDELIYDIGAFSREQLSKLDSEHDIETKRFKEELSGIDNSINTLKIELSEAMRIAVGLDLAAAALCAVGFLLFPGAFAGMVATLPAALAETEKAATKGYDMLGYISERHRSKKEMKLREADRKDVKALLKSCNCQFSQMVLTIQIISRLWQDIAQDIGRIQGKLKVMPTTVRLEQQSNRRTGVLDKQISDTLKLYGTLLIVLSTYYNSIEKRFHLTGDDAAW